MEAYLVYLYLKDELNERSVLMEETHHKKMVYNSSGKCSKIGILGLKL